MAGSSRSVLDDLAADLPGPSRAGGSRPARRITGGGGGGELASLCPAIDQLNALMENRPDFAANRRLLQQVAAKAEARKREETARAAARQAAEEEAAEDGDEAQIAEEARAHLARLERLKLNLGDLQQWRETEAVLVALPPADAEPRLDIDAGYLQAVAAAVAELGLEQEVALEDAEVAQEVFRCGLRSGLVRTLALQRRAAGQPLVAALFATLAHSPNSETAGAAFVTLMALMGDGAPSSSSDGTRGGADAAADATASVLMLDAHYGLPAAAATSGAVQQPACRLDCLPTNAQLLEALRANGYSPKSGGGGGGGGRQQGGAAAAVQQGEEQAEGLVVRLQPIKLVLRTAAAVCRYCRKHPDSPAAAGVLSREGVGELLAAALHIGLDPAANQLQEDCDAATAELLGALEEADWLRKLPQLAERSVEMGPSNMARLKLLRKLPASHPRGLALQQFAGALLLERLLPGKWSGGGGRSAINRRDASALDAAAVIAAQPWFTNPKGLVLGATSGGGQAPRGGYTMGALELVLKCCHLLLWPHMLSHAAEEPSCLTADFLAGWQAFLTGVHRNIKSMQPEDKVVQVLASSIAAEFTNAAEGLLPESGAGVADVEALE